ncbi:hypothetical protein ACIA8O_15145 [Kitasatospora sp. NPDC051853]|uniref:hypothetical protein n=1 Tax=Kitasatospora sp. NPDC051853 TaxID=3364058 RepID=UPI003791E3D6
MLVTGLVTALSSPAVAEEPGGTVNPCEVRDICIIVTEPGGGGTTPGGGTPTGGTDANGVPLCTWNGVERPCWDSKLGWFSTENGCYYKPADPQPPATDPAWGGNTPQDGKVYDVTCRDKDGNLSVWPQQFFPQPPVPMPVYDNVADLGLKALAKLRLRPPAMHTAPAGKAAVGVPVWLWYERTADSVGPVSETAAGNVLSVTATAELDHVEWTTGEGDQVVTCKGPGTPYTPGSGAVTSPDCQHVYANSSAQQPDGRYYVSATAVWKIKAVRNDTGQRIRPDFLWDLPAAAPMPIEVAEVQLLN